MRLLRPVVFAVVLVAAGCARQSTAVVLMVVTVSGTLSSAVTLQVSATGPAGLSTRTYTSAGGPIVFPTTLTAEIPSSAVGSLRFAVSALGADGTLLATGETGPEAISIGESRTVYVQLVCPVSNGCQGPPPPQRDGSLPLPAGCGNGVIDPGETCDIAIAAGAPGACPPAGCDDGIPCTSDRLEGSGCTAVCIHEVITDTIAGDGCCPTGSTSATDSDCSATCGNGVVDTGETCDLAIPAGQPGACPSASDCSSVDRCVVAQVVSGQTCSAICLRTAITEQISGDGCCPAGASNAGDTDCPAVCGDGVRGPGETCDVGIPPSLPGTCPVSCDTGDPCMPGMLYGAGCQALCVPVPIRDPISGDGCCPPGATRASDTDCPAACGDGIVEAGETCDPLAAGAGTCPTSCPPSPFACLQTVLVGTPADCSAICQSAEITACGLPDGCCPSGCTAERDLDCSATCGDGAVQTGETCDTAIGAGDPGACPTSCNDGDPCTDDRLLSGGTCQATCVHLPITVPVIGDGCCPPGANFLADADCAPVCGDGIVESPVERCDKSIAGSCPTSCPPAGSCSTVTLDGTPATCSAACSRTTITTCLSGDGCCPPGCTAVDDTDCWIICGDSVVETGETCDRGITAGLPGACAATCDDGDACTVDLSSGSIPDCTRTCMHWGVTACLNGDGCCPAGCTAATDNDCAPSCGDGRIEAGETCDPPSTCPTTCPDDGDPCTQERQVGDPHTCNVSCQHVPITKCSGAISDGCCPSVCDAQSDTDC